MAQSAITIAYFTVVEDERTGWTGGLLLLNGGGRPLEFQCTLPVRPSRAHEILFGPTLRDHIIGEVIGPLLVKKCRTPIGFLCCDQPESLIISQTVSYPIALVVEAAELEEGPITDDTLIGSSEVALAGSTLRVPMEQVDAVRAMTEKLIDLPDAIEPFERIREAIKEAQSQIARSQNVPTPRIADAA
ncbi:hypothetical protein [Rubripirellula reticaptiva]|uniref:Uncharacterized protein n=1 Tax=Rubripirellula reticaptiva TaxID=2528013 RepID=A0A5C6EFB0_9BACT|nr:hypothetical protein [Rubripirellula reticaptiva]TWU48473.1 hypothetical protein Poly59_53210 [Rubripirellula reticaptiva]